jgi:hypothetical protein
MSEDKQPLHICPQCGLPFKAEDNLILHIENWHSDDASKKQGNKKQTDPAELLWRDLVHRVFETPEGFQGLSEPEKRYYAVCILDGEVYNGGFEQYFFNSSGSYYKYTILGLEEMDAPQSLALLQNAKLVLFDDEDIPESTGIRREFILQHESDVRSKLLENLDEKFWQDPDGLGTKITTYAKLHGLL